MELPSLLEQRVSSITAMLDGLQADYGVEALLVITRGNVHADRLTRAYTSQKCASFLRSVMRTDVDHLAEQIEGYAISGAASHATIMPPVTENMKQKEQIKVARTIIMNGLVEILRANNTPEDQIPKTMNYRNYEIKVVNQYGVVLVGFPGEQGVMNPGGLDAAMLKELLARLKDGRCYWKKSDQPDQSSWSPNTASSSSLASSPRLANSPGTTPGTTPPSSVASCVSSPRQRSPEPTLAEDCDEAMLGEGPSESVDVEDVRRHTPASVDSRPLAAASPESHTPTSAFHPSAPSPNVSASANPQDIFQFLHDASGPCDVPLGTPIPPLDFGTLLHQFPPTSSPNAAFGFGSPVGFAQNPPPPMGSDMRTDPVTMSRMYMAAMQLLWASNPSAAFAATWPFQGMSAMPVDMGAMPFSFNGSDVPMAAHADSPHSPSVVINPAQSPVSAFTPPTGPAQHAAADAVSYRGPFDQHMSLDLATMLHDPASHSPTQTLQPMGKPNMAHHADHDLNMETAPFDMFLGNLNGSFSH